MFKSLKVFKKYSSRLFIGAIFGLLIALVVLLMPDEREFKFEFQQGKPWMHEALYAPFSFPIYKTDQEIADEKEALLADFLPYYSISNVLTKSQQEITRNINEFIAEKTEGDTVHSENILKKYLNAGIVSLPEKMKMGNELFVINGKFARKISKSSLYTVDSAKNAFTLDLFVASSDSLFLTKPDTFGIGSLFVSNVNYEEEKTELYRQNLLNNLSLTFGMIEEDVRIISNRELISPDKYKILQSLKREYENQKIDSTEVPSILVGQSLISVLLIFVLILLLNYSDISILESKTKSLFIVINVLSFIGVSSLLVRFEIFNIYAVPFVLLPILVKTFFKASTAAYTLIVVLLISAALAPNSFEFLLLQFIAGGVGLFSLGDNYRRKAIFVTSIIVFITYALVYIGIGLQKEASLLDISYRPLMWFGVSSLLILASSPIIYIQEKMFGFVSDMTLVELSDTNNKLLRKISEQAPGTFQHSLQVANIAEYVCSQIGGNALLVRAGALYHDLGKTQDPQFFIENQSAGANPHDRIEPRESARKIIDHTVYGEKLARKNNLPEQVISFITSHHGGSKVYYFYKKQQELYPKVEPNMSDYTYPGKRPQTKEEAVLMMTDAIEAASRSLKEYTDESLSNLVNSIIDSQMKANLYEEADITFKEIFKAKELFADKLKSIYHSRIAYPK